MTGGKLYVPNEHYLEHFLPAYARDITDGVHHFVIERATDESRWYADIDCPGDVAFEPHEWVELAKRMQTILETLAGTRTTMLVLKAHGSGLSGSKFGLHFVAPQVVASAQQMTCWRDTLKIELVAMRPDVDWEEVFDLAVYKGGSLRMPLSRKMVSCNTGKRDVGRAYELYFFLNRDGVRDPGAERALRDNMLLLVTKASIRLRHSSTQAQTGRTAPRPAYSKPHRVHTAGTRERLCDIVADLPEQHSDLEVLENRDGLVKVTGHGAHFCQVVGREHRSSTVYYVIDQLRGRAFQRCWCRKGMCSSGYEVPFSLHPRGPLPPGFSWG